MSGYRQTDPWLESTSLDALLSMPSQPRFDFGSLPNDFTGLATPPEEPADFIQRLANQVRQIETPMRADTDQQSQNQVLACLRWLGEFQVLALIPLRGSIPAAELAELANVPISQLSRVVRMTATAGFLCELQPGETAHTTLSARFVTDLSFFDAIMFLAESAAPTALNMATATERQGRRKDSTESAYSVAFNTTTPFQSACLEQPRLQRRYDAYMRCTAAAGNSFIELLGRLSWCNLRNSCVVDANAQSTEVALALLQWNSSLRITVQTTDLASEGGATNALPLNNPNERFSIQTRAPGGVQCVKDAAAYILRLTDVSTLRQQLMAELNAHLPVLRGTCSTLIIELPFVPEPGSVEPNVEMTARLSDLSRSQLTNECDLDVADIENLINSVQDSSGKLVAVTKLRSRSSTTMAVGIKYESAFGGLYSAAPLLA